MVSTISFPAVSPGGTINISNPISMKTRAGSTRHTTEGGMDPNAGIRSATRHSYEERHEHYHAPTAARKRKQTRSSAHECGTGLE